MNAKQTSIITEITSRESSYNPGCTFSLRKAGKKMALFVQSGTGCDMYAIGTRGGVTTKRIY